MNLIVDILIFLKYRLFIKNFRKCSKTFYEQLDITETNIFLSDFQYHPSRTIHDNYKDWICALARQLHTVKTSDGSQMNLKRFLHNIAFSAQLPRKFSQIYLIFVVLVLFLFRELVFSPLFSTGSSARHWS